MAARGLRLLYESLTFLLILNCLVTTIVCQEMVIRHRKAKRAQISATASSPAGVVRGNYGGSEEQFGSSLWSLLQTMDAVDTMQFDKIFKSATTSDNLTRTVHMSSTHSDQRNSEELSFQLPSATKNGPSSIVFEKHSQGLQRDSSSIVQILARSEFSSSSQVQPFSATQNSTSSSSKHSMSKAQFEHEKIEHPFNGSDEVTKSPLEKKSSIAVTEAHRHATVTTPQDSEFYSLSYVANSTPFVRESRREATTPVADEGVPQQHPPHRRNNPRLFPNHHPPHHFKPNVERTTQPSRNIMYVVMMQDRPCDGVCCRRESYSGKCRLSMRCAVRHFYKTGRRQLTCGTSYHSVEVPVRSNPSWEPLTPATPAFPGIENTNVRKASTDVNDTKEAGETSVTSTPMSATQSTQSLVGRDNPEVATGNTVTETSSDADVDLTPARTNGTGTCISSDNGVAAIGNSRGVDDSDKVSSKEKEVSSWITDLPRSNGTIDADVRNAVNATEKSVQTTEATAMNDSTESSLVRATSPAILNRSESVDYENTTVDPLIDIALVDKTNETLDIFDAGEDVGDTFDKEEVDDGFSDFFDGEFFGNETDDVLTNETGVVSHNETADDEEFGEFDAYVTDEQSDIDYNDDDYTRDVEYQDGDQYHTDYVQEDVNGGQATNGSPRHLVYTDQVWYGGTDLALGPRELTEQEEVQLSSPNNWHSFGSNGDAEWLNEENKRQPHLVLSSLTDRQPTGRV